MFPMKLLMTHKSSSRIQGTVWIEYTPVNQHSWLELGPELKMYFLLKMVIFYCHVSLPEGIQFSLGKSGLASISQFPLWAFPWAVPGDRSLLDIWGSSKGVLSGEKARREDDFLSRKLSTIPKTTLSPEKWFRDRGYFPFWEGLFSAASLC